MRGFRIELGEIEAVVTEHPDVASSATAIREDAPGDRRLVAYVAGGGAEATAAVLRRSLLERLPEYMVPSVFVLLQELPLTPNGKVDRARLPAPDASRPDLEEPFLAPRTPLEEEVAEIWKEILGVDRVGVNDSFWSLGGHSLLATKVLSRIEGALGVELPLQSLFEAPTLTGLTAAIGQRLLEEQGEGIDLLLSELDDLSEEEIRAMLEEETR
jgi:acyl carrier protein